MTPRKPPVPSPNQFFISCENVQLMQTEWSDETTNNTSTNTDDIDRPPASIFKPVLATLASTACQFFLGAMLGQSSTMLPQLKAEGSSIRITDEQATWIASMGVIGTPMSSILCGPLTDKLGRKRIILVFLFLSAVGHALLGYSSNLTEILIGRFLLGTAAGFGFPSLVYISEISTPKHRSLLLSSATISASLGLTYVYSVGGSMPWDRASLITASLSLLALVYACSIPESPAWLFQHQRRQETIESLKWLKGQHCNIEVELKLLEASCNHQKKRALALSQLTKPTVFKPFLVLSCLAFMQNGTGFYILLYYSVDFLREFKTTMDPQKVSIALALTRLISCTVASLFIKRLRRRTVGIFSGLAMAGILGVIYLSLTEFREAVGSGPVPVLSLLAYIFACSLGVHPLPWLMIFELYPLSVRGLMCGLSNSVCYLFTFLFLKLYYVMITNLQIHGTILLFLCSSAAFGLFSAFLLPETQGKTLLEIEQGFMSKKDRAARRRG
ncbi:unnamed protein product [Bemisia tabaci]|uniref:Major facilitator superfamily (MFS) profile domain-containing protein n=1 Tax=Bemisia tabaci TaxID=7038 RepID=A0A9P0AGI2_BEMTA|nr:unnamed protein product [Bemisia tabaci]